ncbi:MAG: SCP2 domain-containing protein [Methylophilaceae bacterium]|nr:SCP2 sterol-binding domain-containing protein [Methylophilaceae bacterium]
MKLTADALNHLLRQNSWASEQLRPYVGKIVRISMPPLGTTLVIDPPGEFSAAPHDAQIDAEIGLSPSAALRMLLEPDAASGLATLQGDADLAAAVGKVLRGLRWDAEEDLSRIVGDIPAHELSQAGARIRQEIGRQAMSVAGMLSEFWLEEQPQIAKKRHLDKFSKDVDALRDDVERFAKRVERLEKNL